jgi:hypothetical protein
MYADHNRLFYSPLDPDISKLQLLTVLDLAYNQLEYVRDVCIRVRVYPASLCGSHSCADNVCGCAVDVEICRWPSLA